MRKIIKKTILLFCLSTTLAWGAGDEERKDEASEKEVPQSGARPGGEAKKSKDFDISQSRANYSIARDAFDAALTPNPEGEINHGAVTESATALINARRKLHQLLVANTKDQNIKVAYIVVLFTDLQKILSEALPSINILVADGMVGFLKSIFGEIDCVYNGDNLFACLQEALLTSGDINDVEIKDYVSFLKQNGIDDFVSWALSLQNNNRISRHSQFQMIVLSELVLNDSFLALLQIPNKNDNTSLHLAVQKCNTAFIKALIEANVLTREDLFAFMQIPNENDNTPLHLALINRNTELIKALLEANILTREDWFALMQIPNENGETPLHLAVEKGNTAFIKALLEANVLTREDWFVLLKISKENGNTPLHLAFLYGRTGFIKALIEANVLTEDWFAFMQIPNENGDTPLHLACMYVRTDIFKLLLELCEKDPQFARMLKKLLGEIQSKKAFTVGSHLSSEKKKEAEEAFAALLAWLKDFNPNEECNDEVYSSSEEEDDDDNNDGRPVITITMPTATHNTTQTGNNGGRTTPTRPIFTSSSSR